MVWVELCCVVGIYFSEFIGKHFSLRDHPLKTSSFFRGVGVKNLPNLPTDSSKKMPTEGG